MLTILEQLALRVNREGVWVLFLPSPLQKKEKKDQSGLFDLDGSAPFIILLQGVGSFPT